MKKIYCFLFILTIAHSFVWAQEERGDTLVVITGQLLIEQDSVPLPFATVYNEANNRGTITDTLGLFSVLALKKDTIKVSFVGFHSLRFCMLDSVVGKEHFVELRIRRKVHEIGMVNIMAITWQQFKNQIINMELDDPPGPDVKSWINRLFTPYELAALTQKNNPGGVNIGFSLPQKWDKSRRKVKGLEKQRRIDIIIEKKYNAEIVREITGLTGDELLAFMKGLNFDRAWLLRSSEYDILLEIKRMFGYYEQSKG